jgi:hypothetical protein
MGKLVFIFSLLILGSCSGSNKLMNAWIGSSKENLILDWGIPSKTVEIEPGGEILVFAEEVKFHHFSSNVGPASGGYIGETITNNEEVKKWQYTIFLVDPEGTIYHLTQQFYSISPDKLNFEVRRKNDEGN